MKYDHEEQFGAAICYDEVLPVSHQYWWDRVESTDPPKPRGVLSSTVCEAPHLLEKNEVWWVVGLNGAPFTPGIPGIPGYPGRPRLPFRPGRPGGPNNPDAPFRPWFGRPESPIDMKNILYTTLEWKCPLNTRTSRTSSEHKASHTGLHASI